MAKPYIFKNKKSGYYYLYWYKNTKRVERSLNTKDRKIAEIRLGLEAKEIEESNSHGSAETVHSYFIKILTEYKDTKSEDRMKYIKLTLNRFEDLYRNRKLRDINHDDIQRYISNRKKNGGLNHNRKTLCHKTINKDIQILKMVFKDAVMQRKLMFSPMDSTKYLDERDHEIDSEPFTIDELREIFYNASKYLKNVCRFLHMTSTRLGEATHLEWTDLDFKKEKIHIRKKLVNINGEIVSWAPKGKKDRAIWMYPLLYRFLVSLERKSNFVFANQYGNFYKSPTKRFYELKKRLNLRESSRLYLFRHTAGTSLSDVSGDSYIPSKILGHSNSKITEEVYLHPDITIQKDVFLKYEKYLKNELGEIYNF